MKRLLSFFLVPALLTTSLAACQPPMQDWTTHTVADHLFIPWEITYGPDGHIWFTQKNGYICRLEPDNGSIDTLYHQPQTVIQGEGGMLGLALATNFQQNPYVFVAYEYLQNGQYMEKIVRLTYDQSVLGQDTTLLSGIRGAHYHNGCRLLVAGNKLFITTGDATDTGLPQDITSLNGKILRINFDGSIPADNPIAGSPVWSWGHRNAQGLALHNGLLYSTEHGPSDNDEVNIIQKGRNYGWPAVHGFCDLPSEQSFCNDSNVVAPLIAWTPTIAPCGIAYYHHNRYPQLQQSLLMTTLKDEHLYQLRLNQTGDTIVSAQRLDGVDIGRIRDICLSPDGRIFVATSNSPANGSQQIDKIIEIRKTSGNSTTETPPPVGTVVYPNPTTDIVYFSFPRTKRNDRIRYQLFDVAGKCLQTGVILNQFLSFAGFSDGIYFIKTSLSDHLFKIIVK